MPRVLLALLLISCIPNTEASAEPSHVGAAHGRINRPRLFVSSKAIAGLRSVDDLRVSIRESEYLAAQWQRMMVLVSKDEHAPVILPATYKHPSRREEHRLTANPDYWVCHAAGQRILRNALASLILKEDRYRDMALRQIDALLHHPQWSDWRDRAHRKYPADLRNGSLGRDMAIAYDWMFTRLTVDQRSTIVEGLDRKAIQPFWESVEKNVWWVDGSNNWMTAIVGGMGIAGMALAGEHADADRLVDFSRPRMMGYAKQYGRMGEFNESVGYSAATRLPVTYFTALRYATSGRENHLTGWPYVDTTIWNAYTYLPPGRSFAFGDTQPDAKFSGSYFAAVAAASQNLTLQWFYLNTRRPESPFELPLTLLSLDESLKAAPPASRLPLGKHFPEHGSVFVSRTSWDTHSTPCVVYGKSAIERHHEHHDAGQVCVDGHGRRLIIDLGAPSNYPADFFGSQRWRYYNASWIGHNLVTIDGQEMNAPRGSSARVTAAEFDDRRGAYWQLDLTTMYPEAQHVRRSVGHLYPGVVAVLDEVALQDPQDLTLRWHTFDDATPDADGGFFVRNEHARLSGRIIRLGAEDIEISRGRHAYQAPFHLGRTGIPLVQRHESFVRCRLRASSARILTLLAVLPKNGELRPWDDVEGQGYRIDLPEGSYHVMVTDDALSMTPPTLTNGWRIRL